MLSTILRTDHHEEDAQHRILKGCLEYMNLTIDHKLVALDVLEIFDSRHLVAPGIVGVLTKSQIRA